MIRDISASTYRQLISILLRCGPFDSNQALRATFVDRRISLWRDSVQDADSPKQRVIRLIDFLCDKYNSEQENALILFLYVLRDQTQPGDICYHDLEKFANEFSENRQKVDINYTSAPPIDSPQIRKKIVSQGIESSLIVDTSGKHPTENSRTVDSLRRKYKKLFDFARSPNGLDMIKAEANVWALARVKRCGDLSDLAPRFEELFNFAQSAKTLVKAEARLWAVQRLFEEYPCLRED